MATKKKSVEVEKAQSDKNVRQRTARSKIAALAQQYSNEPRKPVSLSPQYQPYFGKVARISLNGISIFIPCNGRTYDIPESFAAEIRGKIYRTDQSLQRQNKASEIKFERYAGELKL